MIDRGHTRPTGGARDHQGRGPLPQGAGHGLSSADDTGSCACMPCALHVASRGVRAARQTPRASEDLEVLCCLGVAR